MIVYVIYSRGTRNQTIQRIKKLNIFSNIVTLPKNTLKLKTKKSIHYKQTTQVKKIQTLLLEIPTIKDVLKMYPILDAENTNPKMIHIFADIDSTLTHTGVSSLNKNVKSFIKKFADRNCSFYFCTGRSYQNVVELNKLYNTGEYGIAENGGIIVGIPTHKGKFGDRTQPKKLIQYMLKHKIPFTVDPNQKNRKTEYVLLRDSITESSLKSAIKKSKAQVEYHSSKNTFHISKKGINKGTAIDFLTSIEELDLDSDIDEIIAIGDSDLDVPMFKVADKGYLVGKPDATLKKKIRKINSEIIFLSSPPQALAELYSALFSPYTY